MGRRWQGPAPPGRLAEALPSYEQTLTDQEQLLGAQHSDTLTSRNNLAVAHHAAVPLYEQTLTNRERLLGPDHPATLQP